MTRATALGVLIAVGGLSLGAYQQPPQGGLNPAALAATKIEKVKDNLYMITGSDPTDRSAFSGGNTGVFITNAGVIVVDTKLTGWGQVLLDKIKTVTDKPVTTIINTHTHGDHTGSNNMFPATVDVVAHENTKANMEKMDAFKGEGAKGLPKKTYKDKMTLGSGKDRVTRGSSIRRCASCRPATCSRGRTRRSSTRPTAAAASSTPRRSAKRSPPPTTSIS